MMLRAKAAWRRAEPRHVIIALCFLATFTAYVERVGFSIAFTALAKQRGFDEQVKGAVMSSFYWGYGASQVGVRALIRHPEPPLSSASPPARARGARETIT